MNPLAMILNLRDNPDIIEKYKEYHRAVWPEVIAGLRGIGVSNMKIFLRGRRLFMYLEVPHDFDPVRDFPRYMESPRARQWDELMRGFQEQVPEAAPDEWWASMEEVFDIDWRPREKVP